ncbi:hypothetical protein KKA14_01200 [bacterium]|nr:hypothetical protein [bacterium]
MNRERLEKEFYEGKRSNYLPFVINDSVEVISGQNKGKGAAVISIEPSTSGLHYLIEFGDGSGDLVVSSSILKLC